MSQIEKYNSLDNTQQKIRISIMDMIIDKGSSVTLQEVTEYISKKLNIEKEYIERTLQYFIYKNIMVVDGNSINFIYIMKIKAWINISDMDSSLYKCGLIHQSVIIRGE